MKKFRKILSVILTLVMVLVMAAPGFAAGTYSITITDGKNGEYEAYQIFKGDLDTTEKVLSNIEWGTGISEAGKSQFGDAAKKAEELDKAEDNSDIAEEFAEEVSKVLGTSSGTGAVSGKDYVISGLEPGYYLVKDKAGSVGEAESYTKFILALVKNESVTPKADVPSAEKKVQENSTEQYLDTADYTIGDNVPFKFTSKVPDMTYYDSYTMIFEDTLSSGFDSPSKNDITIQIGNVTLSDNQYDFITGNATSDDCTFHIKISDLKKIDGIKNGDVIDITFNAKLNNKAVIGQAGNTNEMCLKFSNNPNDASEVNGKTPVDKVIVFTYQLDIEKVASGSEAKKLPGAKFKLYKTVNGGKQYLTVNSSNKVNGWVDAENNASELVTDASGMISVKGLDAGEYYLKETAAPDGYNLLKNDVKVVITSQIADVWDGSNTADALKDLSVTSNGTDGVGNEETGVVEITVLNVAGIQLPSTGGIGTTIFYAAGIVLMAGAVFFVVRRKRA